MVCCVQYKARFTQSVLVYLIFLVGVSEVVTLRVVVCFKMDRIVRVDGVYCSGSTPNLGVCSTGTDPFVTEL